MTLRRPSSPFEWLNCNYVKKPLHLPCPSLRDTHNPTHGINSTASYHLAHETTPSSGRPGSHSQAFHGRKHCSPLPIACTPLKHPCQISLFLQRGTPCSPSLCPISATAVGPSCSRHHLEPSPYSAAATLQSFAPPPPLLHPWDHPAERSTAPPALPVCVVIPPLCKKLCERKSNAPLTTSCLRLRLLHTMTVPFLYLPTVPTPDNKRSVLPKLKPAAAVNFALSPKWTGSSRISWNFFRTLDRAPPNVFAHFRRGRL